MTTYLNPSTRSGGVEQIVVPERAMAVPVDDAPFDDEQYVRVNGEWVPVTTPPIIPDTLAPDPPTALVASGTMSAKGDAVDYNLSWNAPTTNTDATALTDLAYYVVRWRYGTTGAWTTFVSDDTSTIVRGLKPATDFQWNVLARDISGNDSTWATKDTTGLADATGPQKPSPPTLASRLGSLQITWDGLDHAGSAMPADFSHLAIYTSATTGGPWAYAGRLTGASTYFVSGNPIGLPRFVTTIAYDTSGNASPRSDEASIVVVGIQAPDLEANSVTANSILAGAVTADKIGTGELAASVRIIAGPEAGSHAEVTDRGFYAYAEDPVDGVPNLAVRMGTVDNDLFSITSAAGETVASISDEGVSSFQKIYSVQDPELMGAPLLGSFANYASPTEQQDANPGLLDKLPRGIVAYGSMPGGTTYSAIQGVFELAFLAEQGRTYLLEFPGILTKLATANVAGGYYVRMVNPAHTTDGSAEAATPTLSNASLLFYSYAMVGTAAAQVSAPARRMILRCNPGGTAVGGELEAGIVKLLFAAVGSNSAVTPNAGEKMELYVFDVGPDIPYTSVANTSTAAVPQPTQPAPKTYTKTYTSVAAATYKGDGTKRTDTSDVVQGYNSYNGDGKGLWIFPSMTADLAGATVKKVEVYAYANHWYYNAGGTALIKVHGYTAAPASSPTLTAAVNSASWPQPGGRWVTLPASLYAGFKSGTYRGFGLGPAGSTSLTYYGRFNGGTGARIRVTYVK